MFEAAGTPPAEAELVMRHIVGANLVGHDSHGVIQIPTYIDRIKAGHIVPGAPWKIVQESPTTTVVDGHWGFGYVVNERAMRLTIEKAKAANVAAATVFRQGHIGRLSSYTQMAAQAGMIGLDHRRFGALAKGGGAVRRARGKARHQPDLDCDPVRPRRAALSRHGDFGRGGRQDRARRRPQRAGAGRLGHRQRRASPTNDPRQLRQGGALLPLGGPEGGYKGTGLAVMVEILCGLLTGLGFGVEPTGRHNDGCFMAVFKVDGVSAARRIQEGCRRVRRAI